MGAVRRSLAYSLADNYLGMVLQFAAAVVIARLLTPGELGVFAVAAVLAALASTFRDFGVAEFLVQEKELRLETIRSALAANIIVSWAMAFLLLASSGVAAEFYGNDSIADVIRVQALNFFLIPFGAVVMACFRRDLNYRPIFIANVSSNVASFVVAVGGAYLGLGFMSLAWSSLAGVVVSVSVAIGLRPRGFPMSPSFRGLGSVIRFGKHATGVSLFGQIGRSAPEAVIGRVLDLSAVAFYSRAAGLMEVFNRSVLRAVGFVCLPYFAQAMRSGEQPAAKFSGALSMMVIVGWPCFTFVGVNASALMEVLYGAQWGQSVPLAQVLCIAAIFEIPVFLANEVMIAKGRIDQANVLQMYVMVIRLVSAAFVIPFGLIGLCWAISLGSFASMLMSLHFLSKIISLGLTDFLKAVFPGVLVAAAVGTSTLLARTLFDGTAPIPVELMLQLVVAAIVWVLAVRGLGHAIWEEIAAVLARWK